MRSPPESISWSPKNSERSNRGVAHDSGYQWAEYERRVSLIEIDLPLLGASAETAVHYAAIRKEVKEAGTPIPWHDLWIAAQARQHSLPVLSRDAHFDFVRGLTRITW